MIPVFLTNITAQLVRTGLESVRNHDLKEWTQKTFGDSAITKRQAAFKGGFSDMDIGGTLSAMED